MRLASMEEWREREMGRRARDIEYAQERPFKLFLFKDGHFQVEDIGRRNDMHLRMWDRREDERQQREMAKIDVPLDIGGTLTRTVKTFRRTNLVDSSGYVVYQEV